MYKQKKSCLNYTYSSQSTATRRLISWVGKPTAVKINSIVTKPALGILAAPTLAKVAVKLEDKNKSYFKRGDPNSKTPLTTSLGDKNQCIPHLQIKICTLVYVREDLKNPRVGT